MWPRPRRTDESAVIDLVMRMSRFTNADLNYMDNLKFWGSSDKDVEVKARDQDPNVFVKLVRFNRKYDELSDEAKKFVDNVFKVAIEHNRSFYYEGYYKPELLAEAKRSVDSFHYLERGVQQELEEYFPDIRANAPMP
ncbi:hypothetical protein Y032_0002g720 [Ancylostoma ceylanicum]|nr:hypothetical protein Y032_0002g720 [Ancylostoma ceylanicum]